MIVEPDSQVWDLYRGAVEVAYSLDALVEDLLDLDATRDQRLAARAAGARLLAQYGRNLPAILQLDALSRLLEARHEHGLDDKVVAELQTCIAALIADLGG